MNRVFKLLIAVLLVIMLLPYTRVNAASTKTEEVLKKFNSIGLLDDSYGKAIYEDDSIQITYAIPKSSTSTEIVYPYNGNIIQFIPSEVKNYEEAEKMSLYNIYAIKLIASALQLNGYTEKQISDFMKSEDSEFNYEINGIEVKKVGEPKEFVSEDGSSKITAIPISLKIDVTKANINKTNSEETKQTNTTVKDVVNNLKSDNIFTAVKDENGAPMYESEIKCEDNSIIITQNNYYYDYHYIYFDCTDDVLTYESGEIEDSEQANIVSEYEMWASILMECALKVNGYTSDEIRNYFNSENVKYNYELNGIEIKETGKEMTYTDEYGVKNTITPLSIKIDFARANLKVAGKKYEVLDGADQTFDTTKDHKLTFRFNMDYDTFVKEGKIFIDEKEISRDNYTLSKGSTIVTFNEDFTEKLSEGKHKISALTSDGEAQAEFTIVKVNKKEETETTKNPKTGDNIIIYNILFLISIVGGVVLFIKTKRI